MGLTIFKLKVMQVGNMTLRSSLALYPGIRHISVEKAKMVRPNNKFLSKRLDGKTAIITGCNTGIGKYNVLDFYRRGCRVIMACRNLTKAKEAKEDIESKCKDEVNLGSLLIEELNLASLKSVRECAERILKNEDSINILVNNAGVMACPKELTEDGFEMHFGTNHLGHYLFTLLLLPRIIKSSPARIVNVSSLAHKFGNINFENINWDKNYSPTFAYASSKLANILFTKELARRLEGEEVNVYAVHPGVVKTDLGRHLDTYAFPGFQKIFKPIYGIFMKNVEEGSQTQIYCALSDEAAKETGLYYSNSKVASSSSKSNNIHLAKKLWDLSWSLVQLGDYNPFTLEKTANFV